MEHDTDDEQGLATTTTKKQLPEYLDSDPNLLARASKKVQEAVDGGRKSKSKESSSLNTAREGQKRAKEVEKEEITIDTSSRDMKRGENEDKDEQEDELIISDYILIELQPASLPEESGSVVDCHPRDFTHLQLTQSVHTEDSSCDNTPADSPTNGCKSSSPKKYSPPDQLPLNLPDQSKTEMEEAASTEFENESVMEGEKPYEDPKESKQDENEITPSERPDSSTAAANERRTQREIKDELPLSPTATAPPKKGELSRHSMYAKPATIDKGVQIWESGMIYNHKGIKFSIFSCVSEVSTVPERGIEICCSRDNYGYAIMARLCWLVQRNLEERFRYLFSTETPLQKHELTQIAVCPTCLERDERDPSCFLIEACVHALQVKEEYNCKYHTEPIPLRDLIPDYLLLDLPSHLRLTKSMFEYNESKPLHRGRQTVLYNGYFNGKEVAIKMYHQVESRSITLPLSCVRRETDMLSSLNHPNIVEKFGFCLDPVCVLMEKAPLGNLYEKLMDTEVEISRAVRVHIACQVASALSYLHRRDIIYRTLKASSILLWSLDFKCDASIKLANFERAAYQSPSVLMSKITFSSYPAPEMLRYSFGEEYTEKVDIYAFGILLYELVTRWQPYGGTSNGAHPQKPKLSGVVTTSYSTIEKLIEECWQEESMSRPSADGLLHQLSQPSFQCHIASQVLLDCLSVRGCCFVPCVQQIWVYGEYNKTNLCGEGEISEGTQVFILNAKHLTVQGSLELRERATTISTVDNKVWIGMIECCVHAYDTSSFRFTNRYRLEDSATAIADNDCYVFVGQANGHLKCYPKLELLRENCQPVDVEIGDKPILSIVTISSSDIIWLGCGNELVVLSAEDEVTIERRRLVCEVSDQPYAMTVSYVTNTVWYLTRRSHSIAGWDFCMTEKKQTIDLSEHLMWICSELNYDPHFVTMVSIDCVNDTLWIGLSCGVILILTDAEKPEKIVHFKAHKQAVECLLKIPHRDDVHWHHHHPVAISGGFGEVSSLSSAASEQNGVVMLWHALSANELSTTSKRHNKYTYT